MLSNVEFIFTYVWAVQTLKGVFQPRKITAAMITISMKSRRIVFDSGRKGRVRAMEIVEALNREALKRRAPWAPRAFTAQGCRTKMLYLCAPAPSSL